MRAKIKIFDIAYNSIYDGEGVRVVVFLQGCNINCQWCHLPHSKEEFSPLFYNDKNCISCGQCLKVCKYKVHYFYQGEHKLIRDRCILCRECIEACPNSSANLNTGALYSPTKIYDVDELFENLKSHLSIVKSIGGITLSGGEALLQKSSVQKLLKLCKDYGINTSIETSGLLSKEYYDGFENLVDSWIFGMKVIKNYSNRFYFKEIFENISYLIEKKFKIFPVITIIPGYTDTNLCLDQYIKIFKINNIKKVYLNFWNSETDHYYKLSGIKNETYTPTQDEINKSKIKVIQYFEKNNIDIRYFFNEKLKEEFK